MQTADCGGREASADTRAHKTGHAVHDLQTEWRAEAADLGWTPERLLDQFDRTRSDQPPSITLGQVVDHLSAAGSTWTRADVLRAICDLQPVMSALPGERWASALERACDQVAGSCVDLDPEQRSPQRASDGRSLWLEPTAPHITSEPILTQEESVLAWAMDAQASAPVPSRTVDRDGLDALQADAAAAVAGNERLVLVVGPAGTGKTTTMRRAIEDLTAQQRIVFGVAPTAKAARVLQQETGAPTDTVAKLLHEWNRTDRPPLPRYVPPPGATLLLDEAGMVGTASLHHIVQLAEQQHWRLVLVGDPLQLQAVGRGGLFDELCSTGRVHELARIHRFTEPWEAAASLELRAGSARALDAYEALDRIVAGPIDDHLHRIAHEWMALTEQGRTVAVAATTNDHVDALNSTIQEARLTAGQLEPDRAVTIAQGERAHPGDVIATRRNNRQLQTTEGEPVRNRDLWTVAGTHADGSLTVSHRGGHGTVTLPVDYAREQVRLGYAATEHGHQGDTVDIGIALVSNTTTHRGLYVGATRGRHDNRIHVVTETIDVAEARDILDAVVAHDRADIPAVAQRRNLAHQLRDAQPRAVIPDWLIDYRAQLDQRRYEITTRLGAEAARRDQAAAELADLQPALAMARAAWQPYADRISAIERELQDDLRPAMWDATSHAMHSRLGTRHIANRRAKNATFQVRDAEAHIEAIHAEGADVKRNLDTLEATARHLADLARPPTSGSALERSGHRELDRIGRLVEAIDSWTTWATGRDVTATQLAHTASVLAEIADHPRAVTVRPAEIRRSQWLRLLRPVAEALGKAKPERWTLEPTRVELGIER